MTLHQWRRELTCCRLSELNGPKLSAFFTEHVQRLIGESLDCLEQGNYDAADEAAHLAEVAMLSARRVAAYLGGAAA